MINHKPHHARLSLGVVVLLAVLILTACGSDDGKKEEKKSYIIGSIMPNPSAVDIWDGFKAGMADRGYIEGENITYFNEASADLLAQKVKPEDLDLLLVIHGLFGGVADNAVYEANTLGGGSIPVVVALGRGDPVASGYADSLTQPGKNVTGVLVVDADVKRFDLFIKMLHPDAESVAVIYDPANEVAAKEMPEMQQMARQADLEMIVFQVPYDDADPQVQEQAFAVIPDDIDGLFLLKVWASSGRWYQWAYEHKVPTSQDALVDSPIPQPMMGYGPSLVTSSKQLANQVDQIFKGTKPGDLPFEYADSSLTIDLNLAEAIGLELPDSIVGQAQVILRRDLSVYPEPTSAPAAAVVHPEGTGACSAVQTSMGGSFKVCVTIACDDLLDSPMLSHTERVDVGGCATEGAVGVCAAASYDTTYYDGEASTLQIGCGFMQGVWTASETSAGD